MKEGFTKLLFYYTIIVRLTIKEFRMHTSIFIKTKANKIIKRNAYVKEVMQPDCSFKKYAQVGVHLYTLDIGFINDEVWILFN